MHRTSGASSRCHPIQFLRDCQTPAEEGIIGQFAVHGEGQGVPGDVSPADGIAEHFSIVLSGPFQKFPNQPGTYGPDVPESSVLLPEILCGFHGIPDKAVAMVKECEVRI